MLFKPFRVLRDLLLGGAAHYASYSEAWAAYAGTLRRRAARFERVLTPAAEEEGDARTRV